MVSFRVIFVDLDPFWVSFWEVSGSSLGGFGCWGGSPTGGHLGPFWTDLGAFGEHLGRVRGAFWAVFDAVAGSLQAPWQTPPAGHPPAGNVRRFFLSEGHPTHPAYIW